MNQEILDYLIERLATLPELPASQERFDTFIAAATDSFARRSGIESPMAGLPKSPSPLDGYTVPKDPGPLAEPDLEDAESVDFQATEAQESGEIQLAPAEAPETPQDAPGSTIPEKATDGLTERVRALESFLERLLAVEQASGQRLLSIRAEDESAKAEPEVQRSVQGVGDDEPLYLKYQPELLPESTEDTGVTFAVLLTKYDGVSGGAAAECTWRYTVLALDDSTTLATAVTPETPRLHYVAYWYAGETRDAPAAATSRYGLACYDNTGALHLLAAFGEIGKQKIACS